MLEHERVQFMHADPVLATTCAAMRDGARRDGAGQALSLIALAFVIWREKDQHVKIAVPHVPHDRAD